MRKLDVTRTRTTTIAAAASSNGGGGSLEGSFDSNSCGNGTREIVQIQYTSWPDRSAPSDASALLQLIEVRVEIGYHWQKKIVQPNPVYVFKRRISHSVAFLSCNYFGHHKWTSCRLCFQSGPLWGHIELEMSFLAETN